MALCIFYFFPKSTNNTKLICSLKFCPLNISVINGFFFLQLLLLEIPVVCYHILKNTRRNPEIFLHHPCDKALKSVCYPYMFTGHPLQKVLAMLN